MNTVTVWKFDTPQGADKALGKLKELHKDLFLQLHDAAVVSWEPGHRHPKTRQLQSAAGVGMLSGAFWGMFLGLIFFVPFLGIAIGAASGALFGSLREVGLSDAFMSDVRSKVTPGTSALFAVTSDEVFAEMAEDFRGTNAELIRTNLSDEDDARLREVFAEE